MGVFKKDEPEANPTTAPVRPYSHFRGLTASATQLKITDISAVENLKARKSTQRWQEEAWDYFDLIGEISYASTLFSNILSRIRIYPAYVDDEQNTPQPVKISEASDYAKAEAEKAMRRVFGGNKQSQLLRKAGLNLLVVGECYLVSQRVTTNGITREEWKIVSTDELVPVDRGFGLKSRSDQRKNDIVPLNHTDFLGRIWREHPRYSDEPTSSMRALCELCNELLLLSRAVRATARSRLNAGALFLPDELSAADDTPTDQLDPDLDVYVDEERDEFEEQLMDAMTTPIADEESASAVVPLIIRGPSELGEKIKHLKFERVFDPQLTNRADRALERILQGIDMPKEMITGLSNIKYSNAIQINESFYTAHIEPLILMLCDSFRTVYLEPALHLAGVDQEEIDRIVIWYDPSGITTAPDKSTAANVGYDKYLLSGAGWRKANGFSEDDAPTPGEVMTRMAIARGPVTPELTDTIFRQYVPELLEATRASTLANSAAPIPPAVDEVLNPGAQAPPADPAGAASPADEDTGDAPPAATGEPGPPPELID